ncbi:MAG: AraC family transcriptional regulator [Rhodobacteraceae bacterium]|nr:AraC family transcriptional regulator [Paracoccaceae bacterium]MAY46434.1 AraC family transcriptional regulator [Paracoccaceae bacterium]QEW22919.1 HTH-type transcriptional regulator YesS [Marinibacterium anthonyi]
MPITYRSARIRRPTPGLHRIRSPLSRIAYQLPTGAAQLLWLEYGTVRLRSGTDPGGEGNGPRLFWWADGAGREMVAEAGARGTLLSIPEVALTQALPTSPISDQMQRTLSQDLDLAADSAGPVARLLEAFARERQSDEPGADIATSHYLTLLLLQLWRLARKDLVNLGGAPQGLSERFILLAAQHARDHRPVERYAADLKVSRDRLGSAVKRATGLSPRDYLHRLLLRDAMELLADTGMPVSQIAFRLGFVDPAYFTRFFKRGTGQNPGAFRNSARRKDQSPQSFAAWP